MTYSNTVYPVVNLPNLYINNAQISYTSATTLTVQPGLMRDSTDTQDINLGSFLNNYAKVNTSAAAAVLNFATSGKPNSLDTGTVAVSTMYYIFAISDQSGVLPAATLASASATPLLPAGLNNRGTYTNFRLIGYWLTDGSGNLVIAYTAGNGQSRSLFYDTSISVLSGGTSQTLAAIDLQTALPLVSGLPVYITGEFTPNTANDNVKFGTYGTAATVLPVLYGVVSAKINSGQFKLATALHAGNPAISYINSAASGATTVLVNGFDFYL